MRSQHYYRGYSSIFDEVIQNDDLVTASLFIKDLYPLMSDLNKKEIYGSIFTKVVTKGSVELQLLFIESFGLTQEVAKSYINGCLHDLSKDRSLLKSACKYIGDNYGAELAGAFIMGDLEVAEELFKSNLDKRPLLSHISGRPHIDDLPIDNKSEIMAEITSQQLRRLTEIISDAGMRYLIDDEFRVLSTNSLKNSVDSTRSDPFEGALPILDSGVIRNPELLVAFRDQGRKTAFPGVFSKIPCWVKPGYLDNSDKVSLFRINQSFKEKDGNMRLIASTELSVLARAYRTGIDTLPIGRGMFDLKLEHAPFEMEESGFHSAKKVKCVAGNVIQEILPINILSGFNHPDGYELAVIDVSLLENLPIAQPSGEAMNLANDFSSRFFPVSVLTNAYSNDTWDVVSHGDIGFDSDSGLELFRALHNTRLRDNLINLIPKDLWREIYKKCSYKLVALDILAAKELFGFDDSVSRLCLNKDSIYKLYSSGYKFSNDGSSCSFEAHPSHDTPPDRDSYVYFIRMGGWPSNLPKPNSVSEAITYAIRKKTDPIYDFFLLSVGAEEAIKSAKTQAQFNYIYQVFPREDITPLLKLMPRSLKGRHLEEDLGM